MARILLSPPDVGHLEREALLRAFDSGWVAPAGPELDAFESDVANKIGWPGVVALSSGTAALHLAMLTAGVKPGDDVFVSTFTFAATANAVTYCGAHPVFIDSDTATWNMSPALLAEALEGAKAKNRLPTAVIVVDLYGQCADYAAIAPLCHEYGIPLIEDSAEALGATYQGKPAGTLGDVGVFSFNGNKIITTSGGGMFLSPDTALADRVRYLSTQARQPAVHYEHTDIGFNYRLSNLLAAMGRAQLSRLPAMMERRLHINRLYRTHLSETPGIEFMPLSPEGSWNGWLTCLVFATPEHRDAVQHRLDTHDIESRPLWKPMHLQPVFAGAHRVTDGTSEDLFARGLCIPSGSALTDDQVELVSSVINSTLRSAST